MLKYGSGFMSKRKRHPQMRMPLILQPIGGDGVAELEADYLKIINVVLINLSTS